MNERIVIGSILLIGSVVLLLLEGWYVIPSRKFVPLAISSLIFFLHVPLYILNSVLPEGKVFDALFRHWGGVVGLLPPALAIILVGRYVVNVPINEQWGGTIRFVTKSWKFGLLAGLIVSLLILSGAMLAGEQITPRVDTYRYGVNVFSNLCEEVICRGLLLACCVKYWNKLSGILWTSVVFGLMHGVNEKGIFIALISWPMAWAVLKAKSLWAGWTSHQSTDMIVDTLFP